MSSLIILFLATGAHSEEGRKADFDISVVDFAGEAPWVTKLFEDLTEATIVDEEEKMNSFITTWWLDAEDMGRLPKEHLTEKSVKALYLEFKNTIPSPPNPETYVEYSIENGEVTLAKVDKLGRLINTMIRELPDEDIEKYGELLVTMRNALAFDVRHIPLAIRHDYSRDIYWHDLHYLWLEEIERIYIKTLGYDDWHITENDLGRYLVAYFRDIDLNNDGKLESVKVIEPTRWFTNIPDSEWGDDTGTIIRIVDNEGNEIFWNEVSRYRPVENVSMEDVDKDGFDEIIISVSQTRDYKAETYVYGWKDGSYKLISD